MIADGLEFGVRAARGTNARGVLLPDPVLRNGETFWRPEVAALSSPQRSRLLLTLLEVREPADGPSLMPCCAPSATQCAALSKHSDSSGAKDGVFVANSPPGSEKSSESESSMRLAFERVLPTLLTEWASVNWSSPCKPLSTLVL